jgi:serine/threonine-protein kinase
VLYEVLTGRQAFRGATASDTIAAILTAEPDWQALPPGKAANIESLLRRCLQKDIHRRLRDIGDARIEIEEALSHPLTRVPIATEVTGTPARPMRFVISLPAAAPLAMGEQPVLALSPEGTSLVYVATGTRRSQLYLRCLEQFEPVRLEGTEGGSGPFFSPDGRWVGFFADGKLKKISL